MTTETVQSLMEMDWIAIRDGETVPEIPSELREVFQVIIEELDDLSVWISEGDSRFGFPILDYVHDEMEALIINQWTRAVREVYGEEQ